MGARQSKAKVAAEPQAATPLPAAPQLPGVRAGADPPKRPSSVSQASTNKSGGRRGSIFQDAYDMSSFQSHHNRRASEASARRMSIQQQQIEQEAVASIGKKKRKARDTEKAQMQREANTNRVTQVNQYKVVKPLGKGAFGEVYKVESGDGNYAMKILNKSALQRQRQGRFGSALDSVKIEIATMKLLDHPNCVHMFEVIIDPQHDEIVLILEFVPGGTSQRVGKNGVGVPLKPLTIWSYMRHLVMGLEYLHINGIVHRDIKPENLLVSPAGRGSPGLLKIADFGTALLAEGASASGSGDAPAAQKTAGTPAFFSPETCDPKRSGTFDPKVVDLWAIGVTIYVWLCGLPPFNAPTPMLLLQEIRTCVDVVPPPLTGKGGLKGKPMSGPLIELMQGLLTKDVDARLTLAQLRAHPWLTRDDTAPLPPPPEAPVVVSESDIAKAVTPFVQAAGRAGAIQRLTARSLVKQTSTVERDFYDELQRSDIKAHAPLCEVRAPMHARHRTAKSGTRAWRTRASPATRTNPSPLLCTPPPPPPTHTTPSPSSPQPLTWSERVDSNRRSSSRAAQDVSYADTGSESGSSRTLHLPKSPIKLNRASAGEKSSQRNVGRQREVTVEGAKPSPRSNSAVSFAAGTDSGDGGGGGGGGTGGGEPRSPGQGKAFGSSPKGNKSGKLGASERERRPSFGAGVKSGRLAHAFPAKNAGKGEVHVEVEDLTAGMSAPCVMDIKMGCRTATASDLRGGPRADLLAKMDKIDSREATDDERASGGVTKLRYLQFRDRISSISSHSFRIDAAHLSPFQGGLKPAPLDYEWSRLRTDDDIAGALRAYMQGSLPLAAAIVQKLERLQEDLEKSTFFPRVVLLRSSILIVYDAFALKQVSQQGGSIDEQTKRIIELVEPGTQSPVALELKMIDFAQSFKLPADAPPVTHEKPWDGTPSDNEDGYLAGVRNLLRLMRRVHNELLAKHASGETNPTRPLLKGESRLSLQPLPEPPTPSPLSRGDVSRISSGRWSDGGDSSPSPGNPRMPSATIERDRAFTLDSPDARMRGESIAEENEAEAQSRRDSAMGPLPSEAAGGAPWSSPLATPAPLAPLAKPAPLARDDSILRN